MDEVKRIKEITEKISDDPRGDLLATEEEEDERVFVLEELRDRLESVDNAKDLGAIGGLTPLLEGIQSEKWEEIRAMSAECVAVSVQNHPRRKKNATVAGDAIEGTVAGVAVGETFKQKEQRESYIRVELLGERKSRGDGYVREIRWD